MKSLFLLPLLLILAVPVAYAETYEGTWKDTGKIKWINLREELVFVDPSSVDRMFERGYLIDHELYLHQKNNLNIRIFDPTFRSHPMTEAESRLLDIPFLK